ncbi:MAG: DUF429 domain-containing protein [Cyclobacteriaceae bacterium]
MTHVGIDFGSRKAGTTVLCCLVNDKWNFRQSAKNEDADLFLQNVVNEIKPNLIFIDAPLSLPAVYSTTSPSPDSDFHYRKCDREAGAMSPMFLGGLTARAIRLRTQWERLGIKVFETYPKLAAREIEASHYKDDLKKFAGSLAQKLSVPLPELMNWHQADACLAWLSGLRYKQERARITGDSAEGLILF